jgi:hypothetical protein
MTANYKIDSANEIRKYLWGEMLTLGIFDENKYYSDSLKSVINPIVPVQQSPELNQFLSGKKHIVYDKIGMSYDQLWPICTEQILFTIYSTDVSEIAEIRNLMVDLFRRMDESARDINRWDGLSDKIKFHSIYISDISATSPSQEIQGFLSADIVLEVKYSRITDNSGRYL